MNKYKDALEGMVWQFGYKGVKGGESIIWCGGLSALEEAFEVLGWEDPHYVEDCDGVICDVTGCAEWVSSQGIVWSEKGYWCVCSVHSQAYREGAPQPEMKKRAINREASRSDDGQLPL